MKSRQTIHNKKGNRGELWSPRSWRDMVSKKISLMRDRAKWINASEKKKGCTASITQVTRIFAKRRSKPGGKRYRIEGTVQYFVYVSLYYFLVSQKYWCTCKWNWQKQVQFILFTFINNKIMKNIAIFEKENKNIHIFFRRLVAEKRYLYLAV